MPITSAQSFLLSLAATCAIAGSTVPVALGQTPTPTASPAAKPAPTLIERLGKEFEKHQIPTIIAVAAGLGYLGLLWLKPLWLLKVPSTSLPLPWTNWKVPLRIPKPMAGFEPATARLRIECSTTEPHRQVHLRS